MEYVEILSQQFGFRLLTRKELRDALETADGDALLFEEEVCRTCVMKVPDGFPGYDDCLAGIPTEICNRVMSDSGYGDDISLLEGDAVAWAKTVQARMDVLICFCHPKWSLEDLENMDPRTYYKYAAASELILGGVYGMDAAQFLDPSRDGRPPATPRGGPPPPQQGQRPGGYAIQ